MTNLRSHNKNFVRGLLSGYKKFVSPFIGEHCRFHPSCSEYCAECIIRHGWLRGLAFGLWRIVRCNPMSEGYFDPVPERKPVLQIKLLKLIKQFKNGPWMTIFETAAIKLHSIQIVSAHSTSLALPEKIHS